MTENDKRKFDAWESLRDHAWRETQEKTSLEWRLSFGVWSALLASIGTFLATQKQLNGNLIQIIAPLIVLTILILHGVFLYWIQVNLQKLRFDLHESINQMRKLLKVPSQPEMNRSIQKQVSMYVQFSITILLVVIFSVVLKLLVG